MRDDDRKRAARQAEIARVLAALARLTGGARAKGAEHAVDRSVKETRRG